MNAKQCNSKEILPTVRDQERIIRAGCKATIVPDGVTNVDQTQGTPLNFEALLHQVSTLILTRKRKKSFDCLTDRPVF